MPRQMGPEAALHMFPGPQQGTEVSGDPFVPINRTELIERAG